MPSEKDVREAYEMYKEDRWFQDAADITEEEMKNGLRILLSIAKSVLDCKGFPEEREARYIDSPDAIRYNDESYLKTEGFNDALRLCKIAVAQDKLNIPTVGEIERIIYNNKTALEAAQEICELWEGK